MPYLNAREFAELAGLGHRASQKALKACHTGGTWRGVRLDVRQVCGRGGASGLSYEVRAGSLPADLRNRFEAFYGPLNPPENDDQTPPRAQAVKRSVPDVYTPPAVSRPDPKLDLRLRLVREIESESQPNTPVRAAKIRAVCQREDVAENTLRRWLRAQAERGAAALCRKPRKDNGERRVVISRAADAAAERFGVPDEKWRQIADALRELALSKFADYAEPSTPGVASDLKAPFMDLARETGIALPDDELHHICRVPHSFLKPVAKEGLALARFRHDKGKHSAVARPRVKVDYSKLKPMGLVFGDVAHLDILVERDDGTLATPKAVVFMDAATGRVFMRAFLMPAGQMIRGEHVRQVFCEMIADSQFGIPKHLKIDNGREWKNIRNQNFIDALNALGIADECQVHFARPYNPQSKGMLEGYFSIFKRFLSRLRGYIGGDRHKKKTENDGNKPVAFAGSFEQLEEILAKLVESYHCTPKKGRFNGHSPYQKFDTFLRGDAPWRSHTLQLDSARFLLGQPVPRRIGRGGTFDIDGNTYECDALLAISDLETAIVNLPAFGDRSKLIVFIGRRFAGIATLQPCFEWDDPAGAQHNRRRESEQKRQIGEIDKRTKRARGCADDRVRAHPPTGRATPTNVVSLNVEMAKAQLAMAEKVDATFETRTPESRPLSAGAQAALDRMKAGIKPAPPRDDQDVARERYVRAMTLQASINAGDPVPPEDAAWLHGYVTRSAEFKTQQRMARMRRELAAPLAVDALTEESRRRDEEYGTRHLANIGAG